jgi:hypothetical protein
MPKDCENILVATGSDKAVREFTAYVGDCIDFNKIVPMPEGYTWTWDNWGTKWNVWAVDNWGTKWNAYEHSKVTQFILPDDGRVQVAHNFLTAWNPPVPIVRELQRRFVDLKITLNYQIELGQGAGYMDPQGAVRHFDEVPENANERGISAFFILVEKPFTDHELAAWLRTFGWTDNYVTEYRCGEMGIVSFTDKRGRVLAKCLYDNAKTTRRVFIAQDDDDEA